VIVAENHLVPTGPISLALKRACTGVPTVSDIVGEDARTAGPNVDASRARSGLHSRHIVLFWRPRRLLASSLALCVSAALLAAGLCRALSRGSREEMSCTTSCTTTL
jgi:hypothetical protein